MIWETGSLGCADSSIHTVVASISYKPEGLTQISKVTSNQNHTKITQKRKLQANITDEHRCKNPQQNTSKPNPTIH